MTKTILLLFWLLWLLDVLAALYGYREFINGVFGRYSVSSPKYLSLWIPLLLGIVLIICGSLYFKNHDRPTIALIIAVIPVVLALPYALFLGAMMLGGKNNWR